MPTTHKLPAKVLTVPKAGMTRAGFRASCPTCNWTSYRYDKEATAQLCATTHDLTCMDRFMCMEQGAKTT